AARRLHPHLAHTRAGAARRPADHDRGARSGGSHADDGAGRAKPAAARTAGTAAASVARAVDRIANRALLLRAGRVLLFGPAHQSSCINHIVPRNPLALSTILFDAAEFLGY